MYSLNIFFSILIFILPITLITGPAIPDLSITFSLIFLLVFLIFNKEKYTLFNFSWFKISICFWIYLIISSFFAYDMYIALTESLIFFRFFCIPLLIYFLLFHSKRNGNLIFLIIFISIIIVIVDSFYQFLNYNSEFGFQEDLFGYVPDFAPYNRLTGPFKDLVPGAYVSKFAFLGLLFFHIYIKDIKLRKIYIIFYLGICGYLTFISGERMAFATLSLGIVVYIFFNKKFSKFLLFLSLIIMFCLISITMILHPSFNDYEVMESSSKELGLIVDKKYKCKNDGNEICIKQVNFQPSFFSVLKNFKESAYGEIYLLAIDMYKDKYLFGIGLNNFMKLCEDENMYNEQLKNIRCVTHPHNFYLQWLIETGPLGLIFFIAYLISIIRYVLKNNTNYELKLISLVILIILFWPVMSTGSLTKNWLGINTFFILGLAIFIHKIKIND